MSAAAQLAGTLDLFREYLPRKPYYTDDFTFGLRIAKAERAARGLYIQPNGPAQLRWLLYDVDRPGAAMDWSDLNAPPPSVVAQNLKNGHAHLLYLLEEPVCKSPNGRPDPLRYAAAVDCALRVKLDADAGYAGVVCKNPLRDDVWGVNGWELNPYTLGDLDSWLDLDAYKDRRRRMPDYGLGRNCNLFNSLRMWAYKAIRQGWPDLNQWETACYHRAIGYNRQFSEPLPESEVKHTARSVARWTHRHLSEAGFAAYVERTHAPEIQAQRGARKGAKRRAELLPRVEALAAEGKSQREIARALEIDHKTVGNWLKRGK